MIRKILVFHGRVQGVGFRFTAIRYANGLGLTGWVKNQYDGTVLMEVQGHRESINKLLQFLNSDLYIRIDSIEDMEIPLVEHDSGFGLRS